MDDMRIKELRIYSAVSKLTKPIADSTTISLRSRFMFWRWRARLEW